MRILTVLAVLLSIHVEAQDLRLTAVREKVSVNNTAVFHLRNVGEADARDAVVTLELEQPGLEFYRAANPAWTPVDGWTCTSTPTTATCTIATFPAGASLAIIPIVRQTDPTGGHRRFTVTASALDTVKQTAVVDIVADHRLLVTTNADFGAGSLRAAIEEINAQPMCGTDVPCVVRFSGPMVIAPATPLPTITKCNVDIEGWFADPRPPPVFVENVVLSGEHASYGNGLHVRITSCTETVGVDIAHVTIHSWPWNGILYDEPSPSPARAHTILGVKVGTDATGLIALGNGARGIALDTTNDYFFIGGGISSANGRSGIAIFRGKRVEISDISIGVGRDGTPMGNGASGVFSLGTPFRVNFSTIAYNAHYGIALTPGLAEANLESNAIHSNGGLPIDWNLDGPSPVDDETDGIVNTPRVLDAFYDAGSDRTIVRGEVRLRADASRYAYNVDLFSGVTPRGDTPRQFIFRTNILAAQVPTAAGQVPFEITYRGDLRGQLVAIQIHGVSGVKVSSEISEGFVVR